MKFYSIYPAILIVVLLCLSACTKIEYIGEEYPPTTHVDLFFDMDDVTREYKVIGHLIATADDAVSAGKMQKKMIEKAKEKGADAVVITGFEKYQSGSYENSVDEKKKIKAVLLKYL